MHVKASNGFVEKFPYFFHDLRKNNPNTSFPKKLPEEVMASYSMFPVEFAAAPEYDPVTHRLQQSSQPELIDGKWLLTKTVVALTPEQIADRDAAKGAEVRTKRDNLIAATDWRALSDNTLTAEWATYRQALRDITVHANFPYLTDADWPAKPD